MSGANVKLKSFRKIDGVLRHPLSGNHIMGKFSAEMIELEIPV
jgi:hypothetical protein